MASKYQIRVVVGEKIKNQITQLAALNKWSESKQTKVLIEIGLNQLINKGLDDLIEDAKLKDVCLMYNIPAMEIKLLDTFKIGINDVLEKHYDRLMDAMSKTTSMNDDEIYRIYKENHPLINKEDNILSNQQ